MTINKWRYCWAGLLLFCACERIAVCHKIMILDNYHWSMDRVLNFSFQVKDIAKTYDVILLVTSTQDYPYQNLYITHHLEDAVGHLLNKALKNYPLFDSKTGSPLGSGLLQSHKHEFAVVNRHQFAHTGSYTVKLEHSMRTDTLPGLQAVGIKVVPSK